MDKPPSYDQQQPAQPGYPQGYGQQQPPVQSTVVVAQPTILHQSQIYSSFPANVVCPRCQANIVTNVSYTDGLMVWMVAGGICLFGGWLGCCLIPFCVNSLKDCTHSCPNCSNVIGSYQRI